MNHEKNEPRRREERINREGAKEREMLKEQTVNTLKTFAP